MARWLAIAALLVSALCFAVVQHLFAASQETSAVLPLPPVGYTVSMPFELSSDGQFALEAQIPSAHTGEVPMREDPPLQVQLEVSLEREGAKTLKFHPRLHHGGEMSWANLQLYFSDPMDLEVGSYMLKVRTLSSAPTAPTSALLTLSPVRDQSGALLALTLLRFAGWLTLALGVVAAVVGAWPNNSFKRTSLRDAA
jgi:hypothetical protein